MKTKITFYQAMILLLSLTLFMGCKKDDDDNNNNSSNQMTYNEEQYPLSDGIVAYLGDYEYNGKHAYVLVLHSSGISLDPDEFEFMGQGHFIGIEIVTSSDTGPEGTYSFDGTPPFGDKTFVGNFGLDYTLENETGGVESELIGGTIEVEKSGSDYMITIECTDEYGEKVTGYYKGSLDYYDWSGNIEKSAKFK